MSERWWLYMLECRGGFVYVGIAKDVDARFRVHLAGAGAKFTRINPPLRILARQEFLSRREAAQAEYIMKRLKPHKKREWAVLIANGTRFSLGI